MDIKVSLDENAIMPTKAHEFDAGWDLYTPHDFTIHTGSWWGKEELINPEKNILDKNKKFSGIFSNICVRKEFKKYISTGMALINTGVHIEIPEGYVGLILPKSGLNVKNDIVAFGVIDAGYTGPIHVKLYNLGSKDYTFKAGQKITQLIITKINTDRLVLVDHINQCTERGDNRFGSSGL